MTKKAFITGATGYTGREVVSQLVKRGVDTVAHIRPGSAAREEWTRRFAELGAVVDVTPWDEDAFAETLRRVRPDLLFFLVGTTKSRMRSSDEDASYEAIDYGLFKLLIDACHSAEIRPKILYLSALGTGPSARNAYYRARWKSEEALRESDLPYLIARPAMITGPDRPESRPLERFGGALADLGAEAMKLVGARQTAARWRSATASELAGALIDYALDEQIVDVVLESQDLKT